MNIQNTMRKTAVAHILKMRKLWKEAYVFAVLKLIFAAGGNIDEATNTIRNMLCESKAEKILKYLCREVIREHLLHLDPHENPFIRVPRLPLPKLMCDYLLYDMSLDGGEEEKDNDKDDD